MLMGFSYSLVTNERSFSPRVYPFVKSLGRPSCNPFFLLDTKKDSQFSGKGLTFENAFLICNSTPSSFALDTAHSMEIKRICVVNPQFTLNKDEFLKHCIFINPTIKDYVYSSGQLNKSFKNDYKSWKRRHGAMMPIFNIFFFNVPENLSPLQSVEDFNICNINQNFNDVPSIPISSAQLLREQKESLSELQHRMAFQEMTFGFLFGSLFALLQGVRRPSHLQHSLPIACLLLDPRGKPLAWSLNVAQSDICVAHAEFGMLLRYFQNNPNLKVLEEGCILFTTLQSCSMCRTALDTAFDGKKWIEVFASKDKDDKIWLHREADRISGRISVGHSDALFKFLEEIISRENNKVLGNEFNGKRNKAGTLDPFRSAVVDFWRFCFSWTLLFTSWNNEAPAWFPMHKLNIRKMLNHLIKFRAPFNISNRLLFSFGKTVSCHGTNLVHLYPQLHQEDKSFELFGVPPRTAYFTSNEIDLKIPFSIDQGTIVFKLDTCKCIVRNLQRVSSDGKTTLISLKDCRFKGLIPVWISPNGTNFCVNEQNTPLYGQPPGIYMDELAIKSTFFLQDCNDLAATFSDIPNMPQAEIIRDNFKIVVLYIESMV